MIQKLLPIMTKKILISKLKNTNINNTNTNNTNRYKNGEFILSKIQRKASQRST